MDSKRKSIWKTVRLVDCCTVISGATPRRDTPRYWNGNIAWVTPKDLSNLNENIIFDTPEKITDEGLKNCSSQILPPGSILFSSRAPIGLIAITGREMCTNQGFKSLIPGPEVQSEYLFWVMKHITPRIQQIGRGATFKEVSKAQIEEIKIPLPPLPEQKRIAAILDKADAIRRKRAKALQLTDTFLQSVFIDMFGDPVTNPKGWPTRSLADSLSFLTSGSRGWARYYSDKGHLFLRIQNVGQNGLLLDDVAFVKAPNTTEARRTKVQAGDVLLSITADLGRTAVIPDNFETAFISQHLALLRVKDIVPLYLSAYLSSDGGQRQISLLNRNGVKAGLNFDDIRSLEILVPETKLQKRYAEIYAHHIETQKVLAHATSSVDFLYESLIQRTFRESV